MLSVGDSLLKLQKATNSKLKYINYNMHGAKYNYDNMFSLLFNFSGDRMTHSTLNQR